MSLVGSTRTDGRRGWRAVLDAGPAAVRAPSDGQDPLDEAAQLRLKHRGLT